MAHTDTVELTLEELTALVTSALASAISAKSSKLLDEAEAALHAGIVAKLRYVWVIRSETWTPCAVYYYRNRHVVTTGRTLAHVFRTRKEAFAALRLDADTSWGRHARVVRRRVR